MPCGATLQVTAVANREDDVDVTDHADIEIRVLPVLPRERTDSIIRGLLRDRGWVEQPDGSLHKEYGDAVAVLPPDSNTVRVTLSDQTTVRVTASSKASVATTAEEEGRARVQERAAKAADAKLADAAAAAKRSLEAKTAETLLKVWNEVRVEIDEVINATTKQALQERASELGQIDSVHEARGDNGYEITITVRT